MFTTPLFLRSQIAQFAAGALLLLACVKAEAQTNIAIGSTLQPSVQRFGMNLSNEDFYDAGQMTKSLVFRNPGFEGEIYQSTIRCASGTANIWVDDDPWSAWPSGFWNGATFEVFYGASQGRTGTITSYTAASGVTGGTYVLSTNGVAPATGDYMIVRMSVPGNATAGWWPATSGNGSFTTNFSDLPPGTTGTQTLAASAPTASDSATLNAYFDGDAGRSFILLDGTFQLSFMAKGTGGSNAIALNLQRIGYATYLNQTVQLTNNWATYTFTFTAAESGSNLNNVALSFGTVGQDSFELDDVSLMQTNSSPSNPSAFRDPVVTTLQDLNPGVLRFWAGQLGDTLNNLIADPNGRQRAGYLAWYTEQTDISYGLQEFLQLCATVGAQPWFVVPSTFSITDASNLIEYLAGSSSTPYGSKRAARGQTNPWTTLFSKIHLEFGNEAWNSSFDGGSILYPQPYGQRAQAIFAAMRANAAYNPSAFDLVLGGQAVNSGNNQDIQNNCNNNDSFAVAPYMMNTVNLYDNQDLFGSTFAEPEAYVSPNGVAEGVAGGLMTLNQQAIQASNHPVPVVMYEMNLSTLSGSITPAALNSYVSSLGAGLAVADAMLQQMGQGVLIQNLWNLPQYNDVRPDGTVIYLWGAVVDMGVTNLRRPQYLALQLANQAIGQNSTMLQTVQTGANPTWNQPLVNTVQLAAAHYLQSYAFSSGSNYSLIVFNLNLASSLPVTFSGAHAPSGTVQITTLTSANITDTNEAAEVVSPVSTSSTNFNPSSGLSLPPYSMSLLTWAGGISNPPVITSVTASSITTTSATITWTTNQASSSQVAYGTTTGYGSLSPLNPALVTAQSVTLTGLTPGTTYNYAAISADSGGTATSANFTFSTPPAVTIPVISAVMSSGVSTTSATITWTTDQASSSQVAYGTTVAYGLLSALNPAQVTSHSVSLTGLTPGTTYNYVAISTDSAGTAASANFTFSTPPTVTIPVISAVTSSSVTTTSATITWTTNQASSSQVAYGTTTAYGLLSALNPTLATSHSVSLTGLTPGTTYNYAAISTDSAGTATSANFTFSTPSASSGTVIAPVGGSGGNTGGASVPTSLTIRYSSSSGNTIVAVCALGSTTSSIGSITDAGSAWTFQAGVNNGTAVRSEIWSTSAGGSVASKSFTVNISGGAPASCGLEEYAGVSSIGATAVAQATSGTTSVGLTTQEANDYIVAGLGANSYYGYTVTNGTTRQNAGLTSNSGQDYVEMVLCDNTATSVASISCTSVSGPASWAAPALELRPGSATVTIPVISAVMSSGVTTTSATIMWTTNQASSSQVAYGTSTAYSSLSALNPTPSTSHSVSLTGLTPGTTYNYAAISTDSAGTATSANFTFSTPPAVTIPVISAVASSGVTTTSATITWTTDQSSSSQVAYGTTTAYGFLSALNPTLVTSHSVSLTGLTPGTTYNYAAISTDSAGTATSANFTFSTPPAVTIPVISAVTSSGVTTTSATITWTTDQASSSQVTYGTTIAYGLLSALNPALVTSHSVSLTGLTPGTTYNYMAISTDSAGTATSPNFTFSTPPAVTIPVISAVTSSSVTTTSATITWTTNQASTSQVAYGTTTAYLLLSALNPTLVTSHSVSLTGLTPGTTYNYAAVSTDSAGTATSANFTFSTPPASSVTVIAPVGGASGNTGGASVPTSLTIRYSSSSGNTIVAVCALGSTTSSIGSITDAGSAWTFQAGVNNGTAVRSEIWSTSAGGSVASRSFTINIAGGTPASCALEEYAGVSSIGASAVAQATSGTTSVGLTTQEANDYIVAGLGANSYYGYTVTNGTMRQKAGLTSNSGQDYVEMVLCDNTAALATSISCSSVSGPAPWAAPALELRPNP